MRIGFYMQWPKGSFHGAGNVIGDELYAEAMCRVLRGRPGVEAAELYAPNDPPQEELDVVVYLNDTVPSRPWARRHVVYVQNGYGDGSDRALARFQAAGYDGYAFISRRLYDLHVGAGHDGIFLPFGVDTAHFRPRPPAPDLSFEVAYIGNDIKGEERTTRYVLPAIGHDFGLFGNWALPEVGWRLWRHWTMAPVPDYRRKLAAFARGKLAHELVPVLFSSARINLNCTLEDCVRWDVVTLRTYEVLACGGFLISDRVPAAARVLSEGAVFTEGGPDLVEKIEYYLAHDADRRAIAERGRRYVIEHATLDARMTELLGYLRAIA